jgi:DNA-binding SARP family transcriptional activator
VSGESAVVMQLRVLGGFELLVGGQGVALPRQAQRVLGCLAVVGACQRREALAGRLWGGSSQDRAQGNLRNALWRVRQACAGVVEATRELVRLRDDVEVDLAVSERCARELIDHGIDSLGPVPAPVRMLELDLLPAWDEDWIVLERERVRQLRIHALEALSRSLARSGCFAHAVEAALAAVGADPLRESANAVLIEAHLAEGNRSEAARQLASYRAVLADELGLAPSPRMEALVADGICLGRREAGPRMQTVR